MDAYLQLMVTWTSLHGNLQSENIHYYIITLSQMSSTLQITPHLVNH